MKEINNLFWERLYKIYSQSDIEIIKNWLYYKKRKVSFRINTLKSNEFEVTQTLNKKGIKFTKINFIPNCFVLDELEEKSLWDLDIFTDWKIYIQWISSQIPALFLDLKENDTVLDVTAAPWSKTSQI
jgi:16S rRNA C967 or C1407 C5-methylase (RsmB/RsmF family)